MANTKEQVRRYIDLSGGMNTYVSDSLILDNQNIRMVNLVNDGNKISVIPGYAKHTDGNKARGERNKDGESHEIQGFAYNGEYLAFIINRDLITYNFKTDDTYLFPDVVGFTTQVDTISNKETYQITIWNDYFIVTNTLLDQNSPLFEYGEPPRIFGHYREKDGTIKNVSIEVKQGLPIYPRWSSIFNSSIIFGGGADNLDRILVVKGPAFYKDNKTIFTDDLAISQMADFTKIQGVARSPIDFAVNITAIINNLGKLFIGTQDGIYSVEFHTNNEKRIDMSFTKITQSGIQNNFSWTNVNNQIFYFDGVSVRILSQEMQNSLIDQNISRNIQKELDCLPRGQKWSAMNFEYPFVKLFLSTTENGEYNDIAFVYNIETQSWSIQKDIVMRYCDSAYENNNSKMNSFFTGIGGIIYQDNDGTSFADEPIDFEWISKGFIFNEDPFQNYKISKSKIYGENDGEVELNFSVITENIVKNDVVYKQTDPKKIKIESHKLNSKDVSQLGDEDFVKMFGKRCYNMKKYIVSPCSESTSGYKQFFALKGKTYGKFNIEQITFHIEQESKNRQNVLGNSIAYNDLI